MVQLTIQTSSLTCCRTVGVRGADAGEKLNIRYAMLINVISINFGVTYIPETTLDEWSHSTLVSMKTQRY